MKISLTNSKLGGQIPSVNLPPVITCRKNAPCSHLCYARKGNFRFPNVQKSHMNNLEHYQRDPDGYFREITEFLNTGLVTYKLFRFHATGDIPDYEYAKGIVSTAAYCPATKFLVFTKQFEIVNKLLDTQGDIPTNLRFVFSAWDKDFEVPNPHNLPITFVNFIDKSKNPEIPETAIPCTGKCYECGACWTLQKGQCVVFNQH